mmetsp:Transcript_3100/g.8548  ORF Transcript_3100/g.8548 Transcript_3100/m.8548 type:complete len:257 (+) Transcript_3100:1343-2113(+)
MTSSSYVDNDHICVLFISFLLRSCPAETFLRGFASVAVLIVLIIVVTVVVVIVIVQDVFSSLRDGLGLFCCGTENGFVVRAVVIQSPLFRLFLGNYRRILSCCFGFDRACLRSRGFLASRFLFRSHRAVGFCPSSFPGRDNRVSREFVLCFVIVVVVVVTIGSCSCCRCSSRLVRNEPFLFFRQLFPLCHHPEFLRHVLVGDGLAEPVRRVPRVLEEALDVQHRIGLGRAPKSVHQTRAQLHERLVARVVSDDRVV